MAEQVVTQFVLDLSQYDAQIASATDSMADYDKEATEAAKANKDLSGSVGSASTKVTQLGSASKAAGKGIKEAGTATKEASKNVGGFRAAFRSRQERTEQRLPCIRKNRNGGKGARAGFHRCPWSCRYRYSSRCGRCGTVAQSLCRNAGGGR